MVFQDVFERFVKRSPLTVITRATMEYALDETALDEFFDRTANRQYTRKLLFSAVVEMMSLVVCKISVRGAFKKSRERIGVTLQAVYDKLDRMEAPLSQMLVRHFAGRLHVTRRDWPYFDQQSVPGDLSELESEVRLGTGILIAGPLPPDENADNATTIIEPLP